MYIISYTNTSFIAKKTSEENNYEQAAFWQILCSTDWATVTLMSPYL